MNAEEKIEHLKTVLDKGFNNIPQTIDTFDDWINLADHLSRILDTVETTVNA